MHATSSNVTTNSPSSAIISVHPAGNALGPPDPGGVQRRRHRHRLTRRVGRRAEQRVGDPIGRRPTSTPASPTPRHDTPPGSPPAPPASPRHTTPPPTSTVNVAVVVDRPRPPQGSSPTRNRRPPSPSPSPSIVHRAVIRPSRIDRVGDPVVAAAASPSAPSPHRRHTSPGPPPAPPATPACTPPRRTHRELAVVGRRLVHPRRQLVGPPDPGRRQRRRDRHRLTGAYGGPQDSRVGDPIGRRPTQRRRANTPHAQRLGHRRRHRRHLVTRRRRPARR